MTVDIAHLAAKVSVEGADKAKKDLGDFQDNVEDSGSKLEATGKRLSDVGSGLTRNVTLPLVAVGGTAVKLALDFDDSMAKIQGLVGVAADEVDAMRGSVLELSGATAKSPADLADALFTVTSAGFRGEEAMSVLEMAAKASAAGMGETRTIAEALTASLSAYGPGVLSAAGATDILVATARAGNFEASQFAGALGQVLPVASSLDIGLEQVGGAVALLTRSNNDASQSITQVRAVMSALLAPSEQAKSILDASGSSMQAVRDAASGPEGLVGALEMLEEATGGNREELARILGSQEAVAAAFTILDAEAQTITETFGAVADSQGTLQEAFDVTAESSGFKMRQAFSEMQVKLVEVGDTVLPIVAGIAESVGDLVSAFSSLPEPVQKMALIGVTAAAAAGPVASLTGGALGLVGRLRGVGDEADVAGTKMKAKMAAGIIAVTAAITIGMAAWSAWNKSRREAKERSDELTAALTAEDDAVRGLTKTFVDNQLATFDAGAAYNKLGLDLDDVLAATAAGTDAFHDIGLVASMSKDRMSDFADAVLANADAYDPLLVQMSEALAAGKITEEEYGNLAKALDEMADAADDSVPALKDHAQSLLSAAGEAGDLTAEQRELIAAEVDAAATVEELNPILDRLTLATGGVVDASAALADAQLIAAGRLSDTADQAGEAWRPMDDLSDAVDVLGGEISDAALAMKDWNDEVQTALDRTVGAWKATLDYEDSIRDTEKAIVDYDTAIADGNLTLSEQEQLVSDTAREIYGQAEAAAEAAEKNSEMGITAQESARIQIEELSKVTATLAPGSPLRLELEGLIAELEEVGDTEVIPTVGLDTSAFDSSMSAVLADLQLLSAASAVPLAPNAAAGGAKPFNPANLADGGFVRAYAHGGVENHTAQLGSGPTRIWNEPETEGEYYIPRALSKRNRSMQVLGQAMDDFGVAARGDTHKHYHLHVHDPRPATDLASEFRVLELQGRA